MFNSKFPLSLSLSLSVHFLFSFKLWWPFSCLNLFSPPLHPHLPPKVNDHISVHLGSAPLSVIKYWWWGHGLVCFWVFWRTRHQYEKGGMDCKYDNCHHEHKSNIICYQTRTKMLFHLEEKDTYLRSQKRWPTCDIIFLSLKRWDVIRRNAWGVEKASLQGGPAYTIKYLSCPPKRE